MAVQIVCDSVMIQQYIMPKYKLVFQLPKPNCLASQLSTSKRAAQSA